MKEIFESTIGDISDPVNMEHSMEIWAKLSKYHDPCDHCVYIYVDASNEPCLSCDHFNKFEKSSFDQLKCDEEVEPVTRADILDQAKKCVCGQREQDYGTPESNFQLIADLWNGYLGFTDNPQWKQIRATDVSMMMALMKIARIRNGGGSGDSFVDLAWRTTQRQMILDRVTKNWQWL